ncbi:MAG: DUF3617 family protein, partial [Magnetococcales bacterium]|nr:DUF3617 family protein [Magnetococcales bacterium]
MQRLPVGLSVLSVWATVAGLAPVAHSADVSVKDGLYQISVSTVMPGLPAMPPQVMRQCMTQSDLTNPKNMMPKDGSSDGCTIGNLQQGANKLSFTIACPKERM